MKTKIQLVFPFAAVCLMSGLTGCDENSWNDKLPGFDDDKITEVTQKETVEYTLTASDYKTIASNSTNKALAEQMGVSKALAAVGTKACFSDQVKAEDFVPAWLGSTSFPYFTLSDGSAVKLTYNVSEGLPASLAEAAAATQVDITEEQYQAVWESDDNYIAAFAPSHPASKSLPSLLKESLPNAAAGDYAIVNYSVTEQEPVFGNVGAGEDEGFKLSSVIANATLGEEITIDGIITGVCTRGYIITDASGSLLVYWPSGFDMDSHKVGTQLEIVGTVSSYNGGFQLDNSKNPVVETVIGQGTPEIGAPKVYSGPELDAAVAARIDAGNPASVAQYISLTGTVAVNGNNINIKLDGAETAQGSAYFSPDDIKAQLVDGSKLTVEGWWIAIAGKKYCNMVVTSVKSASKSASRAVAAEVPTSTTCALYKFDGSKWTVPSGFVLLTPADYAAMGQKYGNLDSNSRSFIPTWLKVNFPYAQSNDVKYVVYKYYANSTTTYTADMFTFDGTEWKLNDGVTSVTNQFVRVAGKWMYDPTVTITLPAGKSQELSTKYYQACVDWVYNEICVPLGDTSITSGKFYVTSYGNNEYYSGTSAYQGNVDLRAGSARAQYEAGWPLDKYPTDADVVNTMKHRFTHEVMPGALKSLHPDAKPIAGLDLYYVINFSAYNGSATTAYTVRYLVTAPATFEFVDCTWDE